MQFMQGSMPIHQLLATPPTDKLLRERGGGGRESQTRGGDWHYFEIYDYVPEDDAKAVQVVECQNNLTEVEPRSVLGEFALLSLYIETHTIKYIVVDQDCI